MVVKSSRLVRLSGRTVAELVLPLIMSLALSAWLHLLGRHPQPIIVALSYPHSKTIIVALVAHAGNRNVL